MDNRTVQTQSEREQTFLNDVTKIQKYLAKRFNLDETDIIPNIMNGFNVLIFTPDKECYDKFIGKVEIKELFRLRENVKTALFTVRAFRKNKGRIIATIDYKANIIPMNINIKDL